MMQMKSSLIFSTLLLCLTGCFSGDEAGSTGTDSSPSEQVNQSSDTTDKNEEKTSQANPGETSESEESSTTESTTTEASETTSSVVELTYNEKAQYLLLYNGCFSCHNNQNNMDFNAVNNQLVLLASAFSDNDINSSSGEDAVVDAVIDALVDLYNHEGSGKPFSRTGLDATGSNMSSKVGHSTTEKENLDLLEAFIIQENNL